MITKEPKFFSASKKAIFNDLLFVDTLRGFDSTGVAFADKEGIVTYKRALPAFDFIWSNKYHRMCNKLDPIAMLGHNRAATLGRVTDATAHPFTVDHITLTHNGTVNNHKSLPDGHMFDVDSEYIAYSIAKFGVQETVKKLIGAFALVWWDAKLNRVFMVRNAQRPLSYSTYSGGGTLVYTSEGDLLPWVLSRNKEKIDATGVVTIDTQVLYEFSPQDLANPICTPVEFYVYPTHNHNQNNKQRGYQSSKNKTNIKKTLELPDVALKELGLSVFSQIDLEIEDFAPRSNLCYLSTKDTSNFPDGADVEFHYYHNTLQEHELYDMMDSILVANVSGCKKEVGSNKYVVYISSITESLKEKKSVGRRQKEPISTQEESEAFLPASTNGVWVSVPEFNKMCEDGCCTCSQPIVPDDAYTMAWTSDHQPICPDCAEDLREEGAGMAGYLMQ